MTVKELKELLDKVPEDFEVWAEDGSGYCFLPDGITIDTHNKEVSLDNSHYE